MENDLRAAVRGEVGWTQIDRMLYSTDASSYQVVPLGVVKPKDKDDVSASVRVANQYGVPVVPRGGGSSLSGQTIGAGIVIDHSRYMNDVIEFNADAKWVRVQSGMVLADLNCYLNPHDLMVWVLIPHQQ